MTESWFDRMSKKAAEKVGIENWRAWIFTAAPQGGVFLTGAVCPSVKRGPRKGEPNCRVADPATKHTVYLSHDECK